MKNLLVALALVAGVGVSLAGRQAWLEKRQLPEGLIQVNGRTEGDHVAIASKFAGRVAELLVREGDKVRQGQTLARLDDKQLQAQLLQAEHSVAVFEAMIQGAESDANAAAANVKAAKTSLRLLRKQLPLTIATAQAEYDHACALSATADSTEGQKRREFERAQKLVESEAVPIEEADQKRLALTVAQNQLTAASAAVTAAEKRLAEARLGTDRLLEKEDMLLALEAMRIKAVSRIEEYRSRRNQATAVLAEAKSTLEDLTITAPCDGTIVSRFADQGEVVSAGSPLFDLVDLNKLYLQVYAPESQIGKLRLGLPAQVYTDAFPEQPFDASVRYIASEAEFTPKEVQTKDERVKLVYAVRIYFEDNRGGRISPGVPADAIIRWKEGTPWDKPRW